MVTILRRFAQVAPVTWANGLGTTTEIISLNESQVHYHDASPWRLSVATLAGPGPFSTFNGVDRSFVIVDGSGLLRVDGRLVEANGDEVIRFAGESVTELIEVEAPCFAVNLMQCRPATDRERVALEVSRFLGVHEEGLALDETGAKSRFDLIAGPFDGMVAKVVAQS